MSAPLVFIQAGALQALPSRDSGTGDKAWARSSRGIWNKEEEDIDEDTSGDGRLSAKDRDLHLHILRGQSEAFQVVVPGCVSVGVQPSGEVTAGHGDAHNAIANTWYNTEKRKQSSVIRASPRNKLTKPGTPDQQGALKSHVILSNFLCYLLFTLYFDNNMLRLILNLLNCLICCKRKNKYYLNEYNI